MTRLIILSEDAKKEISDAYYWYEKKSKGLGKKFKTELSDHLNRIQESPPCFPNTRAVQESVHSTFFLLLSSTFLQKKQLMF